MLFFCLSLEDILLESKTLYRLYFLKKSSYKLLCKLNLSGSFIVAITNVLLFFLADETNTGPLFFVNPILPDIAYL